MNYISTQDLKEKIGDTSMQIIDIRPVDAYNGWSLLNEPRGGHIPGARSLPFKWTKYIDWMEIVRSKGILPSHRLIIYGYNLFECTDAAQLFRKAGYHDITIYKHFIQDWVVDETLPLNNLSRYKNLVYPEWIHKYLKGNLPPSHKGGKTVICHAHYRNRNAYLSGHIPGAIDIDTLALESPATWNRRNPKELEKALLNLGIDADTTVILYGKYMSPDNNDDFPGSAAGHIGAIRCAFIMMYAGVKDVRVLNGGFQSWKDAGYEICTKDEIATPVNNFGTNIPQNPQLAVDIKEAKEMLLDTKADLVSVRSWPEYIGEVSGYNYIEKKGRIPGAIFGNCGSDAYHMENYRNLDHTTREYQEIEKNWLEADISPDKHLAFYCGTGWRGSEAFFNAWLMGWPKVSVFDGGWFEWSNDPSNPYEVGIPEVVINE
jgi:thiosulfate/3-mercaptopyruvate sulfurtransferase